MRRPMLSDLPDTARLRIRTLVERSMPNTDKPSLPDDIEKHLEEIERKTAACYAGMEDNTLELRKINKEIRRLTGQR